MTKLVTKKSKEVQAYSLDKLSSSLDNIFKGYSVKKETLLREFESIVLTKKQFDTREVYDLLINQSLKMCNIEDNFTNLEWRFIASRLQLHKLYKDVAENRGYNKLRKYSGDYLSFVKEAVSLNLYSDVILKEYTDEEIIELSKEIDHEYDYGYDYGGMNLLCNRYLIKSKGKHFELPQEMYMSIALLLALPEKKENRLEYVKKFYHIVASRKISLATPIVLNLRRPKGNLSSCFITACGDSLDDIYYTLEQLAQVSKNAGGIAVNLSRVRCNGSHIQGVKGASSGVVNWVKLVNDTSVAVNQLGSRSGAITVALDIWHYDIYDFLHLQTENGDLRKKAFDIFPQVVVPDLFMKRVTENGDWYLLDPYEIKNKYKVELCELYGSDFEDLYSKIEQDMDLDFKRKIKAKDLFKELLKITVETGMPYVFYKDTVNNTNPNKNSGMVGNANLCVESFSNFSPSKVNGKDIKDNKIISDVDAGLVHVCNLNSINYALVNEEDLSTVVPLAVRILDNAIDLTKSPVPEAQIHNDKYRIIGVGAMGLHDYLAKRKLGYTNSEKVVSDLFEQIAYYGLKTSMELAQERGKYSAFDGSEFSKGIVFGKDKEWFKNNDTKISTEDWHGLLDNIVDKGIRNGSVFAIAPNTSSSVLVGCTASILPSFSKFFIDKASKGSVPICPPYLSQETFWYYQENKNMNQQKVITIVSEIQKWTDQGISMELYLNLNLGLRAKDIYDMYMSAWEKKCKTVYYIRSVALKTQKEDCVSCAN